MRQLHSTCEQPCLLVNALRVQPMLAARQQQFCYSVRAIKPLHCEQQGLQRCRAQASPEQVSCVKLPVCHFGAASNCYTLYSFML